MPLRPRAAMTFTCGVAVATIYFIQPLFGAVQRAFPGSPWATLLPTVTQLGYAAGLFTLVPLGDIVDRRKLIMAQLAGLSLALLGVGVAPSGVLLGAASLAVGLFAAVAQQVVPLAASMATPERRGAAVGEVMTGLLCGILFSRTAAGLVGIHLGWRAIFVLTSPLVLATAVWIAVVLPPQPATSSLRYRNLLASLGKLWLDEPRLRRAALTQASLFAAFSTFWTVLALRLAEPDFHLGADAAGLFGLVGAVGVFAAKPVGAWADRRGPAAVLIGSAGLVFIAWLLFAVWRSLAGLALGVVVLDLGVQSALVSNQHVIYGLRPDARSRVNTVFMGAVFLGGAAGSALAPAAWSIGGWPWVCSLGLIAAALACGCQALPPSLSVRLGSLTSRRR